jgi:SecD/SecF fusion protein
MDRAGSFTSKELWFMFEFVSAIQNQAAAGSGTHPLLIAVFLFVSIGLSILLGNMIARTLRLEQYGWRLGLIFSILCISGMAIYLNWPPRFGVDLRGGITIIGQVRKDVEGSEAVDVKNMIPQLVRRVDPSGTQEILIRPLGTDKIEVVIPDVDMDGAMRIWDRLTQAGELRFRIIADRNYHPSLTQRATDLIQRGIPDTIVHQAVDPPTDNRSGEVIGRWYELGRVDPNEARGGVVPFKFMPLPSHLVRNGRTKQLVTVDQFRGDPAELAAWCDEQRISRLEILCLEPKDENDVLDVQGDHLQSASSGVDDRGRPAVLFSMTREGKRRMGTLTSRNKSDGTRMPLMSIISDGKVITAPSINSTITDRGIIEGRFSQKEVDDLVINLKAGKLEVALSENPISMDYQQSTIGEELKRDGIIACVVSLVILTIVMCAYYRIGGLVASVVLSLNVVLVLAIVMLIRQPLTLTGLAGIVLTIGMSVDANVLIFERIREELAKGAALRMAIRNGYDRALQTIIDANLTTILTGVVLYVIGTEQLKGFAVTLILGILTSMFTAIFCSRVIIEIAERRKWITSLNMMNIYKGGVIDFFAQRRFWYAFSLGLILVGMIGVYFRGTEIFEHDLRGGSTARIVFKEGVTPGVDEVRRRLDAYDGKISDRESVRFTVASINSTDFPNRVFKVDSNIPVWEGEDEAPYQSIDQALVQIFGDELMKLNVDYDPATLQVSRVVDAPQNGDGAVAPDSSSSNRRPVLPPQAPGMLSHRSLATLSAALGTVIPGRLAAEPWPTPQDPEAPPADNAPNQETPPAMDVPSLGEPQNPQAEGENAPAQDVPAAQDDPPAEVDPAAGQAPSMSGVEQFQATAVLQFAQPISRGSLIDAIVTAAGQTNQVALEPEDVTVTVPGTDPDDLSVQSATWNLRMVTAREGDAKLVLDSLQMDYNGQPYFPTISGVGGQIATQTQSQAMAAIMASLFGIILYVWIRFQNVAFGLGAVIALVHDVLVTLGFIALSFWLAPFFGFLQVENFRISLAVIAAFLTLIGYSINDTIVIYDRIREVRGKRIELTPEMINVALSQTLNRTILTSGLTLMAVMVLYFMGGESIHAFAFALVIGIIVGSYSSLFIAAPITLWLVARAVKKRAAQKAAA